MSQTPDPAPAAYPRAPVPRTGAAQPVDSGSLGGMLGDLFGSSSKRDTPMQAMVKSAARSIGSQVGRELIRGVLGSLLKKR